MIFSCLAQQKFDTILALLFGSTVNYGSAAMLSTAECQTLLGLKTWENIYLHSIKVLKM